MKQILWAALVLFLSAQGAFAKEDDATRDMYVAISDFAKTLNSEQTQNFYLLYNNYNLLKTVEVVRGDVLNAVESCSKNNPELEKKMQGHFSAWSGDVDPLLKQSKEKLDSMILAQNYAEPEELRKLFSLVDETRDETNSEFNKVPVSTPEACEFLLTKMDGSQEDLVSLLNATLINYPDTLPAGSARE